MGLNICVIGGRGYVGSAITKELRKRGHDVKTMDPHIGGDHHISLDVLDENLQDHLGGFNAVVNMVGLSPMKQPGVPGYHDLHVAGAENVVGACEASKVDCLVHMSALGADSASDITFLKTKGLGEDAVRDANLETTIFRPSIIFDHGNELIEYAQTFAPFRAFPNIPVGVQPIYRGDVATLFADAVEGELADDVLEIGGPEQMTMFELVKAVYNAKGYPCYPLPILPLMRIGLHIMEYVPFMPFGTEQARFFQFNNTTEDNAAEEHMALTSYRDWVENEIGSQQ